MTLDVAPDAHVLEVGCGIGETAGLFAAKLVADGHVTAFDRAADPVEIARQHAAERDFTVSPAMVGQIIGKKPARTETRS